MSKKKKPEKKKVVLVRGQQSELRYFFYSLDHDDDKLTWKSVRKNKIKL